MVSNLPRNENEHWTVYSEYTVPTTALRRLRPRLWQVVNARKEAEDNLKYHEHTLKVLKEQSAEKDEKLEKAKEKQKKAKEKLEKLEEELEAAERNLGERIRWRPPDIYRWIWEVIFGVLGRFWESVCWIWRWRIEL
jgi:hypothetical protein